MNKKINGVISFAGKSNEGDNQATLKIDDKRAKELIEKLELDPVKYEGTPIKENEEGEQLFKTKSKFPVKIYDNGEPTEDITIEDIGEGSEVQLFIGIRVTKYKGKEYQVADLKGINVYKLEEAIRFNPFEKDADVEEI